MDTQIDGTSTRIIVSLHLTNAAQTIFATGLFVLLPTTVGDDRVSLQMQPVALWVLVTGFALLVIMTGALVVLAPKDVVPSDPTPIGSQASILARSYDLQRFLSAVAEHPSSELNHILRGHHFYTTQIATKEESSTFAIMSDSFQNGSHSPADLPTKRHKPWFPWYFNIISAASSLVLPIGAIIVLQYLLNQSNQQNGAVAASDNDDTISETHFIPALVVILFASLYNMMEFAVSLFTPYLSLHSGNASARRSLSLKLFGYLTPRALLTAVRTRHVAAVLSMLSAILACTLAILVSGLYTINDISVTTNSSTSSSLARLIPSDSFNLTWQNSVSDDSGAAAMLSLIEHNPAQPYPRFVQDTFALQSGSVTVSSTNVLSRSSDTASGIVPAVHGVLDCQVVLETDFHTFYLPGNSFVSPYKDDMAFVFSNISLPSSCHLAGPHRNESSYEVVTGFPVQRGSQGNYVARLTDLVFGRGSGLYDNAGEENSTHVEDSPAVGCSSLIFTFGYIVEDGGEITDQQLTNLVCWQRLQQVDVNATFVLDTATQELTRVLKASMVDQHEEVLVQNPLAIVDAGKTSFDWRIESHFNYEMQPFHPSRRIDNFFQALLYGRDPVDPADLLGEANQSRLVAKIQTLYGRYMALVLNAVMRQSCPDHGDGCAISTTSTSAPARTRFVPRQTPTQSNPVEYALEINLVSSRVTQDPATTLAMQIILGLITLLTALVLILTRRLWLPGSPSIVPHNICTIAGVMTLLAGSELCHSSSTTVSDACECCGRLRKESTDRPTTIFDAHDHHPEDDALHKHDRHDSSHSYPPNSNPNLRPILPAGSEWSTPSALLRLLNAPDGSGRRMKYSLGQWKARPDLGRGRIKPRYGIDSGVRADGDDDAEWTIGARGGVRGAGLGWAGFMAKNASLLSLARTRAGGRASWGSFVGIGGAAPGGPPHGHADTYISGALPPSHRHSSSLAGYDQQALDLDYLHPYDHNYGPGMQEMTPPQPARFASLRGYGYSDPHTNTSHHYTRAPAHHRGLSDLDDEADSRFLSPAHAELGNDGSDSELDQRAAGTGRRKVRWTGNDQVHRYDARSSYSGGGGDGERGRGDDGGSSLYSGDGYGDGAADNGIEDGRLRSSRGSGGGDGNGGRGGMGGFDFGFRSGEA